MSSYQEQAQKREQRINAMRVSDALYAAINGQWAGIESPAVQKLSIMLHYLPEQLIQDILDLRQYVTDKAYEDREKAGDFDD